MDHEVERKKNKEEWNMFEREVKAFLWNSFKFLELLTVIIKPSMPDTLKAVVIYWKCYKQKQAGWPVGSHLEEFTFSFILFF